MARTLPPLLAVCPLAFGVALCAFQPVQAQPPAQTQFQVSVQVRAYTQVQVQQRVQTVDVSAADRARGYVDVPAAWTLGLRTNRAKHQLMLDPQSLPPGVVAQVMGQDAQPRSQLQITSLIGSPQSILIGLRLWLTDSAPAQITLPAVVLEPV